MTTTITVTTHIWPVAVDSHSSYSHDTPETTSHGHSSTSVFVPPNSTQQFVVTNTMNVGIRELPEGMTGLDCRPIEAGTHAENLKELLREQENGDCAEALDSAIDPAPATGTGYGKMRALELATAICGQHAGADEIIAVGKKLHAFTEA